MSRHRRQASQVLPPEIFTGDDPSLTFDPSCPSGLNFQVQTLGAPTPSVAEKSSRSSSAISPQDGTSPAHGPPPGKKPPTGKPASN
ncbi:hypothetical protein Ancab_000191 [Ancistrocladus abbreviatus]